MTDTLPKNKWLLIQIGKDGNYHVFAYTSRRTAEKEAARTKPHGVLSAIVNLDDLIRDATETS